MYLSMMKMKTLNTVDMYLFHCFAISGKPIYFHFDFQVGFYVIYFIFFPLSVRNVVKKKTKHCWTATTVTSISGHHMTCHFVPEWCVMKWATKKERSIMFMIAMHLSTERFLLFLYVSRCISGCHLYLRSDHVKAADCTLETHLHVHAHTQTHRKIRIFSTACFQVFKFNWRKQFLNIVVSCCRCSYCCYSDFPFFVFL